MSRTLHDILFDLVDAFERADIEYVVVGGVAVVAWGHLRTTNDIDVIARLTPDQVAHLARILRPRGLSLDLPGALRALAERSHFTIFPEDGLYHVDMQPAHKASHAQTLSGRRKVQAFGKSWWVASPEDTIANKLVFGSEMDLLDAAAIYELLRDELDLRVLAARCASLGVAEEWARLKRKVDRARPP